MFVLLFAHFHKDYCTICNIILVFFSVRVRVVSIAKLAHCMILKDMTYHCDLLLFLFGILSMCVLS